MLLASGKDFFFFYCRKHWIEVKNQELGLILKPNIDFFFPLLINGLWQLVINSFNLLNVCGMLH